MPWSLVPGSAASLVSTPGVNAEGIRPGVEVTAGNMLIVVAVNANPDTTAGTLTASDDYGNVYTEDGSAVNAGLLRLSVFSAPVTVGGGTRPNIYVRSGNATATLALLVAEFAGLVSLVPAGSVVGSSFTDGASGSVGFGSMADSLSSPSTAFAINELVVGAYGNAGGPNGTITPQGSFVEVVHSGSSTLVEGQMVVADSGAMLGPQRATWLTDVETSWAAMVVVYVAVAQVSTVALSF